MLPFLKPKKLATVIVSKMKDGQMKPEEEQSSDLLQCAEELIKAIHSKDAEAVAKVLQDLQEYDNALDEEQE